MKDIVFIFGRLVSVSAKSRADFSPVADAGCVSFSLDHNEVNRKQGDVCGRKITLSFFASLRMTKGCGTFFGVLTFAEWLTFPGVWDFFRSLWSLFYSGADVIFESKDFMK